MRTVVIGRATCKNGPEIVLSAVFPKGTMLDLDVVAVMPDLFWWIMDSSVSVYRVQTDRVRAEFNKLTDAVARYDSLVEWWKAKNVKTHGVVRIAREILKTGGDHDRSDISDTDRL